MARIAIGGFLHETNTSAASYADYCAFRTQEKADLTADRLIAAVTEAEPGFSGRLFPPAEAVAESLQSAGMAILVDTQDNPGAGGTADTTGLLCELLKQNVPAVLPGVLCDSKVAAAAHIAGVGGTISTPLGGKAGPLGRPPIQADWQVEALGDGAITRTGPFYLGCRMQLGPMARLSCKGVHVLISSRRQQAADQAMFRHLGVEAAEWPIACLKSSVHFRADFRAVTADIRIVVAEGENIADPSRLSYRNLRPTARIALMGAVNGAGIHP